MPKGKIRESETSYTVTSDWAKIKNAIFIAKEMLPLTIDSAPAIDHKSIQVNLSKDPGSELFAGRQLKLESEAGREIIVQYRFSLCKGATGIFDLLNNETLKSGIKYTVKPLNNWAVTPNNVSFIAK